MSAKKVKNQQLKDYFLNNIKLLKKWQNFSPSARL